MDRGFHNILSPSRAPLNSSGVALTKDGDRIGVGDELPVLGLDGSLELSCTESYLNV